MQSREIEVRVEPLAHAGKLWTQTRAFLAAHLPQSWKLFGTILRGEAAQGTPLPRDGHRKWFVAKSADDQVRGVLHVVPLLKNGKTTADVSVFVPNDEQEEAVLLALLGQVRLSDDGQIRFAGLDRRWLPVAQKHAAAIGAREVWSNPCLTLYCPEARFRSPIVDAASGLQSQALRLDSIAPEARDAQTVVAKWKYASEESGDYIAACVGHAPSSCIRRNGGDDDDGTMVAWIGLHADMSLGFFWVEESHRRKGLGKILAAEQVRKTLDYVRPYLAPEQVGAYFFTEDDNDASQALFQGMGFEVVSHVVWASFTRSSSSDDDKQDAPQAAQQAVPAKVAALAKVNLADKFALFSEHWSPKIVGEVDEFDVKVAKLKGEFVWHFHEHEDEMFLIVKGHLLIKVRERDGQERDVSLQEGEFFVVPKGVEHKPIAAEECHVMLLERRSILHTGNVRTERTVDHLQRL